MQEEKISTAEHSWMNPPNPLQEANHYSSTKFCIYCFSLWYKFFVHYTMRVKKIINMVLMHDLGLEFQFLQPRGCLTNPFRNLLLCFGVTGTKQQVSSPVIILLKKSAIMIMSWQDVT